MSQLNVMRYTDKDFDINGYILCIAGAEKYTGTLLFRVDPANPERLYEVKSIIRAQLSFTPDRRL
jgi:hypothetical protein